MPDFMSVLGRTIIVIKELTLVNCHKIFSRKNITCKQEMVHENNVPI